MLARAGSLLLLRALARACAGMRARTAALIFFTLGYAPAPPGVRATVRITLIYTPHASAKLQALLRAIASKARPAPSAASELQGDTPR